MLLPILISLIPFQNNTADRRILVESFTKNRYYSMQDVAHNLTNAYNKHGERPKTEDWEYRWDIKYSSTSCGIQCHAICLIHTMLWRHICIHNVLIGLATAYIISSQVPGPQTCSLEWKWCWNCPLLTQIMTGIHFAVYFMIIL